MDGPASTVYALFILVSQWSKENGLLLEAYSPLGGSDQVKKTLQIPEIRAIAKALGITPAQAIISWQVQRGVRCRRIPPLHQTKTLSRMQTIVLPKSVTPSRIAENLQGASDASDLGLICAERHFLAL